MSDELSTKLLGPRPLVTIAGVGGAGLHLTASLKADMDKVL